MSKASELEAARLAAERNDARCEALHTASDSLLEVIAAQLLAEATYIGEQRKSGWKSRSDAHTAAGRILEQWARDLAAYLERDKPPIRPPLETIKSPDKHADLDPADGPISAQITSGLLAQTSAPLSSIQCPAEYPHKPGARIVRCGKQANHDGQHAEWVPCDGIECDPLTPNAHADTEGHWGSEWTLPVADQLASKLAATHERYPWPDGAITPDAATRVRLAVEAGKDVDDKLDAAFGPPDRFAAAVEQHVAVVRGAVDEMLTVDAAAEPVIYPDSNADGFWNDAVVHITAAPANYAWCDATTGLRGYVGTATCPECIVRWDAYRESETTPVVGTLPGLGAVAWLGNGESIALSGPPDGVILGPGESWSMQWNAQGIVSYDDGSAVPVPIPMFSEPGPAPVRQTQQRMTFEAVRQHGMARARGADHRSYSQVQAFSECGIRYALSDLDITPAWWNVGGTALHYACEHINREAYQVQQTFGDGPQHVRTDHAIETLWTNCLNRSVSETIAEHPTAGPDTWRSAKKGAEGYDWWRTNGVDMVRRWITRLTRLYEQGWTIATFDGRPAIELDAPMWISTDDPAQKLIKVENILDLVMVRGDTFLIIDFKSGASDPTSTYQLGQYGHALNHALGGDGYFAANARILGAYWLARTDVLSPVDVTKSDTATDLRELHPWAEIEYLITTMHAAESQGLYLPNKSKSDRFGCGSCGVAGFCPVGPR